MKSIFGTHDLVGLKYLFQLRVSLSPPRSHKWRHNSSDTPSEICGFNQEHVLVFWPFFRNSTSNISSQCNVYIAAYQSDSLNE